MAYPEANQALTPVTPPEDLAPQLTEFFEAIVELYQKIGNFGDPATIITQALTDHLANHPTGTGGAHPDLTAHSTLGLATTDSVTSATTNMATTTFANNAATTAANAALSDAQGEIGNHAASGAHDARHGLIVLWNGSSWPASRPTAGGPVEARGGSTAPSWLIAGDVWTEPTSESTPPPTTSFTVTNTLDGDNGATATGTTTGLTGTGLTFQRGTGATTTYNTTTKYEGTASVAVATSSTAAQAWMMWEKAVIGTKTRLFARGYFYIPTFSTGNMTLLRFRHENASGSMVDAMQVRLNATSSPAQKVQIMNRNFSSTLWTSAAAFPSASWVRLELGVDCSALTVQARFVATGINEDSGPLAVTAGDITDQAVAEPVNLQRVDFGALANSTGFSVLVDKIGASDTAFLGA